MFRKVKRFLLHMQEVNQRGLHYWDKKLSTFEKKNTTKNIAILLDNNMRVMEFLGHEAFIRRKIGHQEL